MEIEIVSFLVTVWILAGHLAFIDFELQSVKEQS